MFDKSVHVFPIYDQNENESNIPIAVFLAKKIVALKKSYSTSNDPDEKWEIIATLTFHQSALLLLALSFFVESPELTELAKETFRN
jgi:hypothetical protein